MYKKASRGTGGSLRNGYARVARRPSNYAIELAAAHTPYVREIVRAFGDDPDTAIAQLPDYELCLLVLKILDDYTIDRKLMSMRANISEKLEGGGKALVLSNHEKSITKMHLASVIKRWADYRTRFS
ncbi:hypothetical protein J4558_02885 [Leptolyngbya sp. 15MV]|nr:hypothetical protein J4558_02885 [Leptolyngbya sp. 15MV]